MAVKPPIITQGRHKAQLRCPSCEALLALEIGLISCDQCGAEVKVTPQHLYNVGGGMTFYDGEDEDFSRMTIKPWFLVLLILLGLFVLYSFATRAH